MDRSRPRLSLLATAAITALAPACAPKAPLVTVPVAAPAVAAVPAVAPDRPTIDALYRRAAAAEEAYRVGAELIAAGQEAAGEAEVAAASAGIRAVAESCAATAGCDLAPLVRMLERLLAEHEIALKLQAARVAELEAGLATEADTGREPGTSPFVAVMPELGRAESLLRGTDLRQMITLNGPVNAAVEDWLTWMRPMLLSAHESYQFLSDEIAPVYSEAGLPEALLFAMIATESGGKVHVFSRAGAAGLLQFMTRTGRRYGLGTDDGFDLRLDPVAATRANVAYLNERFAELNGSLEKALAAYNGGEGRMLGLERRLNGASFWDSRVYYSLPAETREYVPRVLAAAWLFLHPADYGLEFPRLDTAKTDLVLRGPLSLGELSVCLGQQGNPGGWFRTLRNLNPRLEPAKRLEAGATLRVPAVVLEAYEQRCLDGPLLARAREIHEASHPPLPETITYVVRRSDTLGSIASRHRCVSLGELAAINGIRPPRYVIREGQTLKIPTCGGSSRGGAGG